MSAPVRAPAEAVAPALAEAVARCERLPVLDGALQRVLALADREEAGTSELTVAIEADPGLAAGLLRLVNSAAAVRVAPARSVRQAVALVGRRGVRALALDAVVFRFLERVAGTGPASLGRLHLQAVQTGALAAEAARMAGVGVDRPHLAGLLHDCGRLVLPLAFDPDELERLAVAHPEGGAMARAERRALGADHAHAGALLAAACGLDPVVTDAIAMHHGGDHGLQTPDPVAACVQVAVVLASLATTGHGDLALLDGAATVLGLPAGAPDRLLERVLGAAAPPAATAAALDAATGAPLDDATGLPGRRAWLAARRVELAAGAPGSVVLCVLDGLDTVERFHGPAVTARVLAEAGEVAARHGGAGRLDAGALTVWVPGGPEQGAEVAARLVADLDAALSEGFRVHARAGVTHAPAGACPRPEALLDAARPAPLA